MTSQVQLEARSGGSDKRVLGTVVRPGEGALVLWLATALGLLLATSYVAKAVRQATFVDVLGADRLPYAFLALALAAWPVLRGYERWVVGRPLHQTLVVGCLATACGLVLFWAALASTAARPALVMAFYVWTGIVGILLVTQIWSLASLLLDARQARRLFGLVGAGGIAGSVVGGQLAARLATWYEPRDVLLAAAVLVLVAAAAVWRLGRLPAGRDDVRAADLENRRRAGTVAVAPAEHRSYVRWLAALVLTSTVVAQTVDLQLSWAVERSAEGLAARTAAFGDLYSLMGVVALLVQLLVTTRAHNSLGMAATLRLPPLANAAGTASFALAALVAPALLLPAAYLLKIVEGGLRYSLDQATRELLFVPVARERRAAAKAFVELWAQRSAKGLSAALLLAVPLLGRSVVDTVWVSAAALVAWWWVAGVVRTRYLDAGRARLASRCAHASAKLDLSDASTLARLVEDLGSLDPRTVLHSLEHLGRHGHGRLVPPLLLRHKDAQVRQRACEVSGDCGRVEAVAELVRRLDDDEPAVRAAAVRALAAMATLAPGTAREALVACLHDDAPRVRAMAAAYVAEHERASDVAGRGRALLDTLRRSGDVAERRAAAQALGEWSGCEPALLVPLLYDQVPSVATAAARSVRRWVEGGRRHVHFVPILISRLHDRRLKHDARTALVAYGPSIVPVLAHFLHDANEEIWVRRALPKTLAAIGGVEVQRTLEAALEACDAFTRRKVVEALGRVTRASEVPIDEGRVIACMRAEALGYLRCLRDLTTLAGDRGVPMRGPSIAWRESGYTPHLLERLLGDQLHDRARNLLGLLAITRPTGSAGDLKRALTSPDRHLRAQAVELADQLADSSLRPLVQSVLDDLPLETRLERAGLSGLDAEGGLVATLERLMRPGETNDVDGVWLRASALCFVEDRGIAALRPLVEQLQDDPRSEVRETAAFLIARRGMPGRATAHA